MSSSSSSQIVDTGRSAGERGAIRLHNVSQRYGTGADAVTAVAVGRKLGLPKRVMTILTGESLINDAAALAAAEEESAASAGGDGLSAEGQQAVRQAQSYLSFTAFSRSGLIDQLEFEGFSNADATAAVDSLDVDYAAQAVKQAQSYLTHTAFSRTGLIDQLEFEGYSNADATAAVDGLGIDYNEQAAKQAQSYLSHSAFSRAGLIDQLMFEGYSASQAEYGVDAAGR